MFWVKKPGGIHKYKLYRCIYIYHILSILILHWLHAVWVTNKKNITLGSLYIVSQAMIEPDRIIEYLNSINLPGDCWNKPFISIYIHLGQWLEDLGWLICGFSTWLFFRNSHMVQSEINWQLAAFQVFGWREKLGFLLAKTQSVAWFNTINTTMNSFLPGWISPKMMPWDIHAWGSLQKNHWLHVQTQT